MKQEVNKKNKSKLSSFNMPPVAIIDNIVLSKKEAWAYYILSDKPFDFLSVSAKTNLANATMTALASLCQRADKMVDCHLLISNQEFNPDSWKEELEELHLSYAKVNDNVFNKFIQEQAMSLYERNYRKRITLLGVKLFTRGSFDFSSINPLEIGFKDATKAFKRSVSNLFLFNETEISLDEEKRLREAESEYYRLLSTSSLQARRPSAEECLLTIKRRLYPAMPTPYLETDHEERIGLSDIVIETGGTIEVKPRWLKMSQFVDGDIYEGYRTTLSFSKLPNEYYFPSPIPPFLYKKIMLPFTVNCRFTIVPVEAMKKDLAKKKLEAEDEINNLVQSNQRVNAGLKETMSSISELEEDLTKIKNPWISGNYRITLEAQSEEQIKNIVSAIKNDYQENDFILSWTSGDQLQLLREEMLGGQTENKDFLQTTNLALLGIGGINYGTSAGDPVKVKNKYSYRNK